MCNLCHTQQSRRHFLGFSAMGAAASLLVSPSAFAAGGETTSLTADQALTKLKAGNEKYVAAPQLCVADLAKTRETVAKGQAPWATIVSCADSRVGPESLFGGVSAGELFIARNAGNMVDVATMGTIEYGSAVLGVPLILVLGHERCGAVAAACDIVQKNAKFPGSIAPMAQAIVPAAKAVYGKPGDFVDNTVRESARRTARKIATQSKIIANLVKSGKVKVLAAHYDLDDGKVEFLS
ncbi:MAG: twin-arginine translocation signal domain-containing protein [Methylocystaceae bacterium]|nr:twin-arginine translocation signal domain-containing protein [Methylocystaceae bacterium]